MKFSHGVIAGALVMLVAACGSNAPSGSTTPPKSSSSSPAAPASTPVVTPAPDLTAELLSLSDLPAGWSAVGSSDSGEPKCLDTVRSDLNAVSKAEATYVGASSGLPDLEESLAYVPGKGQSDMLAVSRVLSGCGHVSVTQGGQTLTGTLRSLSFPAVADQSSAYQVTLSGTVSGQSVTLVFEIVVFRRADTVAIILYANPGAPDIQALKPLVRKAVAKVQ